MYASVCVCSLGVPSQTVSRCVMIHLLQNLNNRLICLLPCRTVTSYALTSKETLSKILCSFFILCNEIGLFQNDDRHRWDCFSQAALLRCFLESVPPLIRASHRLSNYNALWLVEPPQAKGKGKGCRIHHTVYHRSLSEGDKTGISAIVYEETDNHYSTMLD